MGHRYDEYDRHHDRHDGHHDRYGSEHDRDGYREHSDLFLMRKVWHSRHRGKILAALAVVAVVALLLLVAAVALVWPLLSGVVEHVEQNGVQGVVDEGRSFLQKLWTGAGAEVVEPASTR